MAAPPGAEKGSPPCVGYPLFWAVDASERASEILLRNGLIFIIYDVPIYQKSCRATTTKRSFTTAIWNVNTISYSFYKVCSRYSTGDL